MKEIEMATDLDLLLSILQDRQDWTTAKQIMAHKFWLHYRAGSFQSHSERAIRQAANKSHGEICSYPGSNGYRLSRLCTPEEKALAVAKFRHQAREMTKRADAIENFGRVEVEQFQLRIA